MSSVRALLLVGCLLITAVAGLTSSLTALQIVDAVNRSRIPGERESPYWWTDGKLWRVLAAYRRLYPTGPLRRRLVAAWVCAASGVVGAGICIGIIG